MRIRHQIVDRAMHFALIGALVVAFGFVLNVAKVSALADASQSAITTNLGIYGGDNWDIAVDGDHVYTIASGVPNGFFYSNDAGATWQRPAGANDYGSGTAVEVDPATHAVYVALDGLYKSTDYGATLTKIYDHAGFVLLFAQGKVLTASNDTLYVSADNGTTFTSVVIATGENIVNLAVAPTAGTFYAITNGTSSKLYQSLDSGATWTNVPVTGPTSFSNVAVKPTDAAFLTLSGDNALWKSTNSGSTWIDVGATASPVRPCGNYSIWTTTSWYACSGFSTNNGSSWTDLDVHTNVMRGPGKTVVVNAADENVMYGDCMSGVCKSTDTGLTWHNSLDGITGVNVLAISQTASKSVVWISSSNGLGMTTNFTSATPTWTWPILPCDTRLGHRCDSSGIGESVWVKPDDANIVLAGSIGGWIYRSTDGGTTWTNEVPAVIDVAKFKTGSNNNLRPQHFINDPTNPNIVYVAIVDPVDHNGAVLKSIDAGITWTDLGITNDAPATRLAMSKTGVLYVGTGEGKTITDHKGVYQYASGAWTLLTGIDTRLNIVSVMVDPEVQTTVYATASNDLAPLQVDGFYKSIDSGTTWTKIIPTGYIRFGAITVQKSTAPNTLYMSAADSVNHGVLLKSSDAGATWGVLYVGLKSESFTTVLFDGLVAGNKHGVFGLKSKSTLIATQSAKTITKRTTKAVTFAATLKDLSTKKLLKQKYVEIWVKAGKVWKFRGATKTNTKGVVSFKVKPTATTQYQLRWKPAKADQAEYTSVTKNLTITVKK